MVQTIRRRRLRAEFDQMSSDCAVCSWAAGLVEKVVGSGRWGPGIVDVFYRCGGFLDGRRAVGVGWGVCDVLAQRDDVVGICCSGSGEVSGSCRAS